MLKKILALVLALIFAINFSAVTCAKTPEEKEAKKEAKLLKKQEKILAKVYRKTNILKVKEWAEGGDTQAQFILAYAMEHGQRVKKDKKSAAELLAQVNDSSPDLVKNFIPLEFYKKKVDLSHLYGLAACHSQVGEYIKQNFEDVIRWAELGASEYDTLSFAVLASSYYTGRGVGQDFNKAIEYAKMSMKYSKKKQFEPIALYILSDAYAKGNGVNKDLKKSVFYSDYLKLVTQPKIDKRRDKNAKKLEKQAE